MTPNRIVAFLTPLVFAPLAGAICAWVAEHLPGVDIKPEQLTSIFIAGSLAVLPPALQWLHGWQQYEKREAEAQRAVDLAAAGLPPALAIGEAPAAVAVASVTSDDGADGAEPLADDNDEDGLAALEDLEDDGSDEFFEPGELEDDVPDPLLDEEDERVGTGV